MAEPPAVGRRSGYASVPGRGAPAARALNLVPGFLLGTADIASRFGMSRQYVWKLTRTERTFPKPVIRDPTGDLWWTREVDRWAALYRPAAPWPRSADYFGDRRAAARLPRRITVLYRPFAALALPA